MEQIRYNYVIFESINNFPKYYISKCGQVLSTKRNKKGKIQRKKFFLN